MVKPSRSPAVVYIVLLITLYKAISFCFLFYTHNRPLSLCPAFVYSSRLFIHGIVTERDSD